MSNGDSASLPVIDDVDRYEKIQRVGEGTYGVVYKVRDKVTGEILALKKVRLNHERNGVPVTSLREIRVLQSCHHPNIVALKGVATGSRSDSIFLVFEYCPHDLGRLLDTMHTPFSESQAKCLILQLLAALAHMQHHWLMHRDIKMSNLLYTDRGELKLCDFGLARYFHAWEEDYTPRVVTLWYRAPEILLGAETYNESIDMWSVGCVLAELLRHEPLFPAKTEVECLHMMCRTLGSPAESIWPGFKNLPHACKFKLPDQPYNYLRKEVPGLSRTGFDLLNRMLTYDPAQRITPRQALNHAYFTEHPLPKQSRDMPSFRTTLGETVTATRQRRRFAEMREQLPAAKRHRTGLDERFGQAFGAKRSSDSEYVSLKLSRQ